MFELSITETKTLKINNISEYIVMEYWENMQSFLRKSTKIIQNKNFMLQNIPFIMISRYLRNHTKSVNLYDVKWHLSIVNIEKISIVSLLIISGQYIYQNCHVWWKVDILPKLWHTKTMTSQNSNLILVSPSMLNKTGSTQLLWWNS